MIEITLFGPTRVRVDGCERTKAELGGTRPQQILEMLAVNLGRPLPKDRLVDWLWDGAPPATAVATVESYVCVLRRGLAERSAHTALRTAPRGYLLEAAEVRVDVIEARRTLAEVATERPSRGLANVLQVLATVTGELLEEEAYAAWAQHERESFARLLSSVCADAAAIANHLGDSDGAVRLARAATAHSVLSEPAWQALMTALWRSGREAEALAAYADLRTVTLEELGVEPGRESQALYLRILRADARRTGGSAEHEVATLVRLLRQALASEPHALQLIQGGLLDGIRLHA